MKRDDLEKLGLEKDVIDQIMGLHGKDVEKAKADLTAAQTESATLKTQLDDANTTIEGFKALDVDGIKKAADDYKAKAEQAEADAKKQVEALKFGHALDQALTGVKAKDPVAVRAHLKLDDLKLSSEGAIIGLEDQLTTIKASHEFLFESDTPPLRIVAGGNTPPPAGDPVVAAMRKAAGLPPA